MRSYEDRPLVKLVRKNDHRAVPGGAWKVAYADFVTAMMAFFLVLWILSLNQDTRKAIAAYFNDPMGMVRMLGGGKSAPTRPSPNSAAPRPGVMSAGGQAQRQQEQQFAGTKRRIEQAIRKLPGLRGLEKYTDIRVTAEGLRIELLDGPESSFFDSGSAHCKPHAAQLLRVIGGELKALPNRIVVEGHTDRHRYAAVGEYGNWELSSDRANAARRAMATVLRSNQIREVRGYADTRPRLLQDPYHYSNRRVSILVRYTASEDRDAAGASADGGMAPDIAPRPIDLAPHLETRMGVPPRR